MDANDPAAARTFPAFLFAAEELSDTFLFDIFKVLEHAHPVFCPVSFVQMFQSLAGEYFTFKTILGFSFFEVFTVLYLAV